ncbi:MAG: ABC transporter ATP-binding protein [Pseudomonadota bacterium]
MGAIIRTVDLTKIYADTTAVDGINLEIPEGVCFGLLGPNGAGKTTTIEMIEGITPPTRGEILYREEPAGERFRREAGIAFQNTALQDFITVGETLRMFASLYDTHADVDELIEACSLEALLKRDNRKLSGGQRQRLLLAIALINAPKIVFLDEPTTGLDPQARRNFWSLIHRIKQRATSIVLTTHYMEEAYQLCDEIAIMDRGRVIAQGTPDRLLQQHYGDVILELPAADYPDRVDGIEHAMIKDDSICHIASSDVARTLQQLMHAGIDLQRLRVRQRDLEDLFIDLTGRELRA